MNCPNCGKAIKDGLLSSNKLIEQDKVDYINQELGLDKKGYCDSCSLSLLNDIGSRKVSDSAKENQASQEIQMKISEYLQLIERELDKANIDIPILTTHTPYGWEYESITIITAQVVMGTGIIAEVVSEVTDVVGMKSGAYASKLKKGEDYCFDLIRKKALNAGGNAVIATDIDYSEVKGMLIICVSGTAVKRKNTNDDVLKVQEVQRHKKGLEDLLKKKNESNFMQEVESNQFYQSLNLNNGKIPKTLKLSK